MSDPGSDRGDRSRRLVAIGIRASLYAVAVVAGLYGLAPITDGDLFWNLNVGAWMLDHTALLPAVDPFTYNAQGPPVQHEWLLQVLFAGIEKVAGLNGLRLLGALCCVAAVMLCHRTMRGHGLPAEVAVALTATWWLVVEPHAVLRPHLVAWLFALVVLGMELPKPVPDPERDDGGVERRLLIRLFLVGVIWANAHASVLIAPLYAGLFTGVVVIDTALGRSARWRARGWGIRTGVLLLAAACQPSGIGLFPYALSTPAINRELSYEWWPLLRADVWQTRPIVIALWGGLVLGVIAVIAHTAVSLRRKRKDDATRNEPAFPDLAAAAFALLHAALTRRMTAFLFLPMMRLGRAFPLPAAARIAGRIVPVAAVLALHGPAALASLVPTPVRASAFPQQTAAFARAAQLQGRMFNPDGWGGYLAWQLPDTKVFADGRWPLVGREVIHDGFAIMTRKHEIAPLLGKYRIDWAVLRLSDYLRVPGPDRKRWVLAFRGDRAVLLLRRGPSWKVNRKKVCAMYAGKDAIPAERARWHVQVSTPDGVRSPSAVPSVLDVCRVKRR